MLQRGEPAVGDGCPRICCRTVALDIQVLGLGAVINRRSLERIGLDVEIGARRMLPVAQDLRVRRQAARRRAAILHIVNQIDGIPAAPEHEGLGHGQPMAVRPRQRARASSRHRVEHEGLLRPRSRSPDASAPIRRRCRSGRFATGTASRAARGSSSLTGILRRIFAQRIFQTDRPDRARRPSN